MIAEVSALLLETTLATSIAAVLVLLLRRPLRRVVGARGAYALWLLLPIAGFGVILPARTVTLALPDARAVSIAPIQSVAVTDIEQPFDAQTFLIAVWSVGALGLGLVLAWQQRRFLRALGRLRTRGDGSWQAEHVDAGPAVIGLWRGRIVLPSDFESRYTELERDLVLRHERVHLARRDPLANLAAATLRCLYWFNPLLHYAVGRFRFDQELAADATVLAQRPEARRSYADAMLKTQLMFDPPPLGCHWQSAHPLKERIAMLKQPLPGAARLAAGFVFALLLSATTGYVAWASQPEQTRFEEVSTKRASVDAHLIRDGRRVKGASFKGTIGAELGLSDDGLELKFSFVKLAPTTVTIAATLKKDNKLLAQPTLEIERGKTGSFVVGALNADGKPLLGVEFEVPPASGFTIEDAQALTEIGQTMLRRPVDVRGKNSSLRAAVLTVAQAAGLTVVNPEVLDDTDKSIDFTFEQTPAIMAITKMVERAGLVVVFQHDGTVRLDKTQAMNSSAEMSALPTYRRISPPKYPKTAIEEKREGKVLLRVLVGADGVVQQVEVEATSGSSDLDEAAKASVRKWTFNAAHDGYKAVANWVGIPVDYSLDEIPSPGAAAPGALEDIYVRPPQSTSKIEPAPELNFGWTDPASGKLGWVESSDQC